MDPSPVIALLDDIRRDHFTAPQGHEQHQQSQPSSPGVLTQAFQATKKAASQVRHAGFEYLRSDSRHPAISGKWSGEGALRTLHVAGTARRERQGVADCNKSRASGPERTLMQAGSICLCSHIPQCGAHTYS